MEKLFDISYVYAAFPRLLPFIPYTLLLVMICVVISFIIGVIFALLKIYPVKILSTITAILVSFLLGVPLLTLLFLFYFGIPDIVLLIGLNIQRADAVYFVIAAFSLHYAAVLSEHLRGAIQSVSQGQFEASFAIGLSNLMTLKRIIIPQALPVFIPNMANTYLTSVKSMSIAFSVGLIDLMSQAMIIGNSSRHLLESYLAVTVLYYLLYLILNYVFKWLEKRALKFMLPKKRLAIE